MRFSDFTVETSFKSATADCYIAVSKIDNKKYFIKRPMEVTYGTESDSPQLKKCYKEKADKWLKYHRDIVNELKKLGNGSGNIAFPISYFVDEGKIYSLSCYVEIKKIPLSEINRLSEDEKFKIMQTCSYSLKLIHSHNIIHFDLKPENIPISSSAIGGFISKITDCDDALFNTFSDTANRPPEDQIVCTEPYWSPELALYKFGQESAAKLISCKNDVFAMGLIFHEWWTGNFPNYEGRDDYEHPLQPYQVISKIWPKGITIDPSVPDWLGTLIIDMLCPNPEARPDMETVFEAIKERKYISKIQGGSEKKKNKVDLSPIKAAYKRIPENLSDYTDESVRVLNENIVLIKKSFNRITTDEIAKRIAEKLNATIDSLEKKQAKISLEKIDKAIEAIRAKDLSKYTRESVDSLKHTIDTVNNSRDRITDEVILNKVYNALIKSYKLLELRSDFPIQAISPLPKPYTKIDIINENEIVAYYGTGGKIKLSVDNALKMKLITRV